MQVVGEGLTPTAPACRPTPTPRRAHDVVTWIASAWLSSLRSVNRRRDRYGSCQAPARMPVAGALLGDLSARTESRNRTSSRYCSRCGRCRPSRCRTRLARPRVPCGRGLTTSRPSWARAWAGDAGTAAGEAVGAARSPWPESSGGARVVRRVDRGGRAGLDVARRTSRQSPASPRGTSYERVVMAPTTYDVPARSEEKCRKAPREPGAFLVIRASGGLRSPCRPCRRTGRRRPSGQPSRACPR